MKTKEEILKSQKDCQNRPITMFLFQDGVVWKMIMDAMEEYKNQDQEAIIPNPPYPIIIKQGGSNKWFLIRMLIMFLICGTVGHLIGVLIAEFT